MAYYFMVEEKKGKYSPLDITKSACFTRESRLKGIGCEIKEIDLFTSSFNHEKELREHLILNGILSIENAYKNLSVRIKKGDKYKKVMYDFLYQKDIQYLVKPQLLIKRINNKLLIQDYGFISEFASHFANDYGCSSTALEVLRYAKDSIRMGEANKHFYDRDENGDMELTRLTKLIIYDKFQRKDGKIVYTGKINNLNLHRVIAFINNYDKKIESEKKLTEELPLSETQVSVKRKTLKKDKQIPGQLNLFDE